MRELIGLLLMVVLVSGCSFGNKHFLIDKEKQRYGINIHSVTMAGVDTIDTRPIFESKAQELCPNGYETLDINRSYDIFTGATYHYVIQCKGSDLPWNLPVSPPEKPVTPAPTTPSSNPANIITVRWTFANIRSGAGDDYPVVTTVKQGDKLVVIGELGEWFNVRLGDGQEGWIRNRVVK